jgi:hypothetical protein
VLLILASWFCVTGVAYASTHIPATGDKDTSVNLGKIRASNADRGTRRPSQTRGSNSSNQPLLFDQASPATPEASPTGDTIKSLATGTAPVNPWFPERGAIGVRYKVTW